MFICVADQILQRLLARPPFCAIAAEHLHTAEDMPRISDCRKRRSWLPVQRGKARRRQMWKLHAYAPLDVCKGAWIFPTQKKSHGFRHCEPDATRITSGLWFSSAEGSVAEALRAGATQVLPEKKTRGWGPGVAVTVVPHPGAHFPPRLPAKLFNVNLHGGFVRDAQNPGMWGSYVVSLRVALHPGAYFQPSLVFQCKFQKALQHMMRKVNAFTM